MGHITLQSDLSKTPPNYVGKHPKDMNKHEYNQMMKDAITGKLDSYPEQKKVFMQWIEEQLNNTGNGVKVETKQIPVSDFKPREDLIQSLFMPLEKRCKVCGIPITVGEYCDECIKQKAGKNYVQK